MNNRTTSFCLLSLLLVTPISTFAAASTLTVTAKSDAGTHYAVSLDSLMENTPYVITCDLASPESNDTPLLIEPHLLSGTNYQAVTLNGQEIKNNEGALRLGKNTLTFGLLSGKQDLSHYNRFDLSTSYELPIQITSCTAEALVQHKNNGKTTAVDIAKASTALSGGFFIAYNDTNALVTLGVGNFFPDSYLYTIYPHNSRTIYVSSDNQNIHIKEVVLR
jgi:hypothetical protein